MSDPTWLPEVLEAAGLRCNIWPGAFDRGHGDFADIWGVVVHHTGDAPDGTPAGPGPIAQHPELGLASQLHLDRAGLFTLCGVGIAWHAGTGEYPGLPTNDANRVTIGIEAENSGSEGWSLPQYAAYVRGVAAILRHLGLDHTRVIGHKEWATPRGRKVDPGLIDMDTFRSDVRIAMDSLDNRKDYTVAATRYPSRVPGSTYEGELSDYMLEVDRRSYDAETVIYPAILDSLRSIETKLDQLLAGGGVT